MLLLRVTIQFIIGVFTLKGFSQSASVVNNNISRIGYNQQKAEADSFWNTMPKTLDHYSNPNREHTSIFSVKNIKEFSTQEEKRAFEERIAAADTYWELGKRLLIEWGIAFWEKFPNDPRRFQWLRSCSVNYPAFFANITDGVIRERNGEYGIIALDTLAKQRWEKYYNKFRKEYLSSDSIDLTDKRALQATELALNCKIWRANANDKFDYRRYAQNAIDYVRKYNINKFGEGEFWGTLLYKYKHWFGLTEDDLEKFATIIKSSNLPAFQEFLHKYENQMPVLVKKFPLRFNAKTIEGKSLELEKLRGKLVLVDFWSLGCASCIEKMPEVKRVYEKYKQEGFEVISACFIEGKREDGTEIFPGEKDKIIKVHEHIDANWPLILLDKKTGEKRHRIWAEYEFDGVPQLLLFNKQGELIEHNGRMADKGGLEKVIKEYIKN